MLLNLSLACRRGLRRNCLQKSFHGHATILDTVEVAVAQVRAQRWEYRLDAPASLLAWVVVVLTRHRQQIHNTLVQRQEGIGQAWKTLRQIADPGRLKASVVDKDGTKLTARTDQCFSKGF